MIKMYLDINLVCAKAWMGCPQGVLCAPKLVQVRILRRGEHPRHHLALVPEGAVAGEGAGACSDILHERVGAVDPAVVSHQVAQPGLAPEVAGDRVSEELLGGQQAGGDEEDGHGGAVVELEPFIVYLHLILLAVLLEPREEGERHDVGEGRVQAKSGC